jgi:hypothetical protein
MRIHGYFTNVSFIKNPRWFIYVNIVLIHEPGQKSSGKVRRGGDFTILVIFIINVKIMFNRH